MIDNAGTLTLDNDVITANATTICDGPGIFNAPTGTLTLNNSTLYGNTTNPAGGLSRQ